MRLGAHHRRTSTAGCIFNVSAVELSFSRERYEVSCAEHTTQAGVPQSNAKPAAGRGSQQHFLPPLTAVSELSHLYPGYRRSLSLWRISESVNPVLVLERLAVTRVLNARNAVPAVLK